MIYSQWLSYFRSNTDHFDHIGWNNKTDLTEEEKNIISSSIKQFQRGEHSEGKHFLRYARMMNDEAYLESVKLFIREEQDHAAVLGRFMDLQGIERIDKDWLDDTFRWLRQLAGLEVTVTVLLTAEIMAFPFYKALAASTGSRILQQICDQILVDEEMHIRFQSYTLMDLYQKKSKAAILFARMMQRVLMAGTIMMVWIWHRKVLKTGGYNYFTHFKYAWFHFRRCEKMMMNKGIITPVVKKQTHAA